MDIDEQKDRKMNPYYKQLENEAAEAAEDDYSEESDADSIWEKDQKHNED